MGRRLGRARGAPPPEAPPPRPEGELVWIHVTGAARRAPLLRLGQRLRELRPGLSLLFTADGEVTPPARLPDAAAWQALPPDAPGAAQRFLAHWAPDCCLWSGGAMPRALMAAAAQAGVPLFLVDAAEADLDRGARAWWPPVGRRPELRRFDAALARDEAVARRLRRAGMAAEAISVAGPLQEGGGPLPCDEGELQHLAGALAGRPVWLAAMTQPGEVASVLQAHRAAMRLSHRLLLILVPDRPEDGPAAAEALAAANLPTARRTAGERPEDTTQVYLADTRGEMGLWYRLAPVTFMASSLEAGHGGRDPYEAAALGSAVIYGPNASGHLDAYARLVAAGAARLVSDATSLSAALSQMIAPDRAASMAEAGWAVVSAGAEVTDRITDLVLDTLDIGRAA
ncbi:3-deoxy-D-manno-octulosonic acid transferase [Rhodosalinus sediminis]|uniref:3-deoxy-D-manno-octulosonic acid transferase n=1 Tax=Rhodosalinus sediminis TaxID=1940533 RepID=UPI001EFD8B7A|nr:glycosyltransferase N-terminal domain-containing protein [Rhodosalinus sediminis]